LTFSTVPTDVVALYTKRIFDIAVSLALLVLSFPIMVITFALIRFTSPGPAIFRQKRCGLHGRVFTLYKFRSMQVDAEAMRKDLEQFNEMDGPVFKIRSDPRVTAVGRFIRTRSLDELPQFWNVFKGDMSIVGPRPPMVEEVANYQRWQRRRLSMRPGITCLWQISGRNDIRDFNEWVKLDLRYIDTWSLALDLKIFLKTVLAVVFRKGAA
jgi:exopolysaccharide biosynthesis polyprenyl glycosylphosphotransferase